MQYEAVIGLEVHCQLKTKSKMFSDCPRDYFDEPPNTLIDPVTLGLPGTLPVINSEAVALTIRTGLALGCTIPENAKFDRKNYPYPDLPKGYQITQYDMPFCINGQLEVDTSDGTKSVRIERIHLEEDTGRLIHRNDGIEDYSLIDFNRAGVPLMELVTHPDIRSAEAAANFLRSLRQIFRYINVSDADLEKGSFRCDANVSLRPEGETKLGNKVEVKNMNSFRSVQKAIEFEIKRQSKLLDAGERIIQETRGYVDALGETVSQRSKEEANDYRYFPEPDLPPLKISRHQVEQIKSHLPELPKEKQQRFESDFAIPPLQSKVLTETKQRAADFEEAVELVKEKRLAKLVANWFIGDVAGKINTIGRADAELIDTGITPAHIASLVLLVESKKITASTAKDVLEFAFETGATPEQIINEKGLGQVTEGDAIQVVIDNIIDANPKAVSDYKQGKDSAVKFLVGQVMRQTKGRADPNTTNNLILTTLDKLN